jgi:hypothetical protein
MVDAERFAETTERLPDGLRKEAIGYRIQERIPYYKGMSGCMVEAPMLWIRQSRFPISFIPALWLRYYIGLFPVAVGILANVCGVVGPWSLRGRPKMTAMERREHR